MPKFMGWVVRLALKTFVRVDHKTKEVLAIMQTNMTNILPHQDYVEVEGQEQISVHRNYKLQKGKLIDLGHVPLPVAINPRDKKIAELEQRLSKLEGK